MEHNISVLKNGLRVIMNKNPKQLTTTITLFVNVGCNWEYLEINGIAHFVEHLFFKGTAKRPSQTILAEELDKYGAIYNAFTNREMTAYYVKVNTDNLDKIIEILGDILNNSLYTEEAIMTEKKVIINEINQRNSDPNFYITNEHYSSFFRGLPFSKSIAGKGHIIKRLNRSIIMAFIYQYYRPSNMVLSISGNFKSYDWLIEHLENHFGGYFYRKYRLDTIIFKRTIEQLENYHNTWNNIFSLIPFDIKQYKLNNHIYPRNRLEHTFVIFSFAGFPHNNENKYKSQLLGMILGSGMKSRLFNKLRTQNGLVYSVKTSHHTFDYNGLFSIEYNCEHSPLTQIKILKLIKEELDNLVNNPISKEELNDIIEMLENQLVMSQENSQDNSLFYGIQLLKNKHSSLSLSLSKKNKKHTLKNTKIHKTDKIHKTHKTNKTNTKAIKNDIYNIKNYLDIINEYKKISVEELQLMANYMFDYSKCLITTYSPVKIKKETYDNIFNYQINQINQNINET